MAEEIEQELFLTFEKKIFIFSNNFISKISNLRESINHHKKLLDEMNSHYSQKFKNQDEEIKKHQNDLYHDLKEKLLKDVTSLLNENKLLIETENKTIAIMEYELENLKGKLNKTIEVKENKINEINSEINQMTLDLDKENDKAFDKIVISTKDKNKQELIYLRESMDNLIINKRNREQTQQKLFKEQESKELYKLSILNR